jgi:hypothetical protein
MKFPPTNLYKPVFIVPNQIFLPIANLLLAALFLLYSIVFS